MTVRQNMGFALKLAKTAQAEIDRKVDEAARILDVERHLDRKPANLSGGQRQRVAMGRAIVRDPSVFLMDEPLSNLDAKLRVQMRTEIARIQRQLGTTTIFVTHDQTEALTLGDRIAVMRAGTVQQVGTPGELYEAPINVFVAGFIGSPSMNFLPAELDGDRIKLSVGTAPIPDRWRRRMNGGLPGGRGAVLVGVRPEDFEDAELVHDRPSGITFKTTIEVLESTGSEFYAHFTLGTQRVSSRDLEELAHHGGTPDLTAPEGSRVVARLEAASGVREGHEAELWVDTEHLHVFDPETGRSMLGTGAADAGDAPAAAVPPAAQPAR
jgi:multiple sugar transport system ATP-binding protein